MLDRRWEESGGEGEGVEGQEAMERCEEGGEGWVVWVSVICMIGEGFGPTCETFELHTGIHRPTQSLDLLVT